VFGNENPTGPAGRFLGGGRRPAFMRSRTGLADTHPDPMEYMGNLFDVAILIGVGFLVLALTGFGLNELLSKDTVTIVKNPGQPNMEIITKQGSRIERLKATNEQAQGTGIPVGTVYRLKDGSMVWVPGTASTAPEGSVPASEAAPVPQGTLPAPQGTVPTPQPTTPLPQGGTAAPQPAPLGDTNP